ncbi:hypothetical protein G9A89_012894 [Geosiphon pyriformis]|nr:hypothetical protein G9A89_012894 [Geosiphon pyriformis]
MKLAIPLISPAEKRPKTFNNICNNKFKVATTPDTVTLEYYQSIYTHCKQKFNIPDGIEIVKKSVYQYIENCINNYIFGNYNISEVRSNLYNNLVHYSQLGTENLNKLNFNIIEYCEEKYPVQSKYSFDFESETKTSNKGKQILRQYSKTTLNTPILPKTTAKYLQTPEQRTNSKLPLTITSFLASLAQVETPNLLLNRFSRLEDYTLPRSLTRQQETLQTSTNFLDYLAENTSKHSETLANEENISEFIEEKVESEEESELTDNKKEDKMTAYIAKIPEFNEEDIETSPQEWLNQVTKAGDTNGWNAARMLRTIPYFLKGTVGKWFENLTTPFNDWTAFKTAFLEQFTDNNTSITLQNHFRNIKQEPSKSVMTYIGKFNKLLRQIHQLKTNDYYSDAQILDQFIAGLKDKLIKKVHPHAPENLNSVIQHTKRYEMAMKEANSTKLLKRKLTNLQRKSKTILPTNNNSNPKDINHPKDRIKTTSHHPLITSLRVAITVEFLVTGKEIAESYNKTNKIEQFYYQPLPSVYYPPKPQYQSNYYQPALQPIQQQYQQPPTQYYQPKPTHYSTQSSYLTIPEEQDFDYTAFSEARIAENANLLDIFPFDNAAANEQKAITAMYTKAEVEGKAICLILNSGSARSIITYQLMQQLKRNTPVGEIDNFSFTFDGITIPVKILVIDAPQYQALIGNDWLQKANANLNWETQELTISYQKQHTWVSATCGTFNKRSEKALAFEFELEEEKPIIETFMALGSTSNWANKTKQQYFSTNNSLETKKPVTTG